MFDKDEKCYYCKHAKVLFKKSGNNAFLRVTVKCSLLDFHVIKAQAWFFVAALPNISHYFLINSSESGIGVVLNKRIKDCKNQAPIKVGHMALLKKDHPEFMLDRFVESF